MALQRYTASNNAHSFALSSYGLYCATPVLMNHFFKWSYILYNPYSVFGLSSSTHPHYVKLAGSSLIHNKDDKIVHILPEGPNSPSTTETLVMTLCCITHYVTPRH